MNRTAILHYHLFKNAGTSLDQVLRQNFGSRWVTAEFPTQSFDNSDQVAEWIRDAPEAVAFSSHTAMGPVPQIEGVDLITVMLLRDPVDRIRSAYRFERNQQADTWGAQLAKQHDLEGYVTARLDRRGDRQCRNFQTQRLATLVPGDAPERQRALTALTGLSVIGLVEDFDGTMRRLTDALQQPFPNFRPRTVRANTTVSETETEAEAAADARVRELLTEVNGDDFAILQAARDLVSERL